MSFSKSRKTFYGVKELDRKARPEGGGIALRDVCFTRGRREAEARQFVPLVAEDGSEVSQNQAGSVSLCWVMGLV